MWHDLAEHVCGRPPQADQIGRGADSGSPSLLGTSNVVSGITIAEASLSGGQCHTQPWDIRVDTPSARAFLGHYVTLP
jgi:hypothetical protein